MGGEHRQIRIGNPAGARLVAGGFALLAVNVALVVARAPEWLWRQFIIYRDYRVPTEAQLHAWMLAKLGIGVLLFPACAVLLLLRAPRLRRLPIWSAGELLTFELSGLALWWHLLFADHWMYHATDPLPTLLAVTMIHTVGLLQAATSVLLLSTFLLWAASRIRRRSSGSSSLPCLPG